jgi:putative transposase
VLTDGRGVPIAVAIEGANRHDMKLTEATLEAQRLISSDNEVRNLCLDKGYDYEEVREIVKEWGYVGHIPPRDE